MEGKSHKGLYDNSICCSVHEKDNEIILSPSINMGIAGSFRHCHDRKVIVKANGITGELCNIGRSFK